MDTACVELKFIDGSMIAIDTIAVENEVADNMVHRPELDWLIYNKPLEYAQLVLPVGNTARSNLGHVNEIDLVPSIASPFVQFVHNILISIG